MRGEHNAVSEKPTTRGAGLPRGQAHGGKREGGHGDLVMCQDVYLYIYIYIYIRDRERERERSICLRSRTWRGVILTHRSMPENGVSNIVLNMWLCSTLRRLCVITHNVLCPTHTYTVRCAIVCVAKVGVLLRCVINHNCCATDTNC